MLFCLSTTITQTNMTYHQLTPQERYLISHLRKQGLCVAQIARQTRRHRSTIAREFARNVQAKPKKKLMVGAHDPDEMDILDRLITSWLLAIFASNGVRSKSRVG